MFGVTGSGKTLVYLEVIRRALELGRGAIVLVPEIRLTPQTVSRVRSIFGDRVAVLHSGLSEGERADAWRALRRGERMRWRRHVVWKGESQAIGRVVRYAAERLVGRGGVRVVIDRDLVSLLQEED